jgi:NADH-dependent fumarate reductase subunit A
MGIGDKSIAYNTNLVEFIEFINIIKVSKLVTTSAISRLESRGSHFRLDYPNKNSLYEKNSSIKNSENSIEFEDVK